MKEQLENIGFIVRAGKQPAFNGMLTTRYPTIPEAYLDFLAGLDYCVMSDEKAWFNTIGDFNGTTDSGFRWNEFELMSLDAYEHEPDKNTRNEESGKLVRFWDRHIPFLMSCRNGYSYFAICLLDDYYGQIVFGSEPEFEDTEIVVADFAEFMARLATRTLDKRFFAHII